MDAKLILDSNNQFTIGIENGDLKVDDGFDTAINISLFTDGEAPSDRIPVQENRRGWLGDLVSPFKSRTVGSLLWLLDTKRLNQDTLNEAINFSQLALNWLVDDGIARKISVTGSIVPKFGIQLKIVITVLLGQTNTYYIKLWEVTGAN